MVRTAHLQWANAGSNPVIAKTIHNKKLNAMKYNMQTMGCLCAICESPLEQNEYVVCRGCNDCNSHDDESDDED